MKTPHLIVVRLIKEIVDGIFALSPHEDPECQGVNGLVFVFIFIIMMSDGMGQWKLCKG